MLYSKINKNTNETDNAIVISIIFGIIVGIIAGGLSLIISQHLLGIILCVGASLMIVLMICGESDISAKIIIIILPTISLTIFEIIYELNTKTLMYPLWVYGIILIIVTEILFLLDKTQPNTEEKDNLMQFTTVRKVEALIEALIILVILKLIRREIPNIDSSIIYPIVSNILIYIIGAALIIVFAYAFIKVNSLRYKKV